MLVLPLVVSPCVIGGCCRCQGRCLSTGLTEKIYHDYTFDTKEALQVV